jgi:hypothetical protein
MRKSLGMIPGNPADERQQLEIPDGVDLDIIKLFLSSVMNQVSRMLSF